MSTPEIPQTPANDPTESTPPVPEPTPEEAAAQQAAQEKAAAEAALADQIRALAAEIAKQTLLESDYLTLRKGTVISLETTSSPPTVTVQISGDTSTNIPGVRYYEHYPPAVGDVVHLGKQGTDLVAMGKIAEQHSETDWTQVTLNSGFSHNGNGNGNLEVRRVFDRGAFRVEFRGGVNRSSGTAIATLDAKYRPVNATRRTILCARNADGSNAVKIDVENTGAMNMIGGTTAPLSADPGDTGSTTPNENAHEHTGTTSVASPGDSSHQHSSHEHVITAVNAGLSEHNHSGAVSTVGHQHPTHNHSGTTNFESLSLSTHNHGTHEHGIDTVYHTHGSHNHTMGSHAHAVNDPSWISFNDVGYWL